MSSYREQGLKAKAVRLGIVDQRAMPGKNKKRRMIVVQSRSAPTAMHPLSYTGWRKCGAYRTEAEANAAMANLSRKRTSCEYRIKP